MNEIKRQTSIIPPILCKEIDNKELSLVRIKEGDEEKYQFECEGNVLCIFTPWQFHVLNALFSFGGDDYESLLVNVNDRFGIDIKQGDIDSLFDYVYEKNLFNEKEAYKHSLTRHFFKPEHKKAEAENSTDEDELEDKNKTLYLFNPTEFLKKYQPYLSLGKYLIYTLPLFLFAALFIVTQNQQAIGRDITYILSDSSIIFHIIFGLFTVSAMATFTTASVGYAYGATVESISIIFLFGFFPRFKTQLDDMEKFNRSQNLWFYAAPLLIRLGLFCIGIFIWYHGRAISTLLMDLGGTLAFLSFISLLITSCPFYRSTGYRFTCTLFNEPNLRAKSIKLLLNKWNNDVYVKEKNIDLFIAYALICIAFIVTLLISLLFVLYSWLNIEIGTKSVIVIGAVILYIYMKLKAKLHIINFTYKKNHHFERWRDRALSDDITSIDNEKKKLFFWPESYRKRLIIVSAILILFFQYSYYPSGRIILLPITHQQISTDIEGIIGDIYFDGGEFVKKGTVIARLSVSDYRAQLKIFTAKLEEQKAFINQLESKPTKEDLIIAKESFKVASVKWSYSQAKCDRERKLYESGTISLAKMSETEQICEVDKQKKIESEAELNKVIAGTPKEEINSAKVALLPIKAQISLYDDRISRSEFKMPFSGKLATLHLKERKGHFLDAGEPLAIAEDASSFKAMLEVPETDLAYIHLGAKVTLHTMVYPEKPFYGVVKTIDSNIEKQEYGRMVKILVSLEKDTLLKSGMSGYAKVEGGSMSVWKILTRSIYRFITVEIWSWIP